MKKDYILAKLKESGRLLEEAVDHCEEIDQMGIGEKIDSIAVEIYKKIRRMEKEPSK